MLGKKVKAEVVTPSGKMNRQHNFFCALNFGYILGAEKKEYAFFIGEYNAVADFEGIVIGTIEANTQEETQLNKIWIVAPEGERYINTDIASLLDLKNELPDYQVTSCIFETSAGAIVYRHMDRVRFLLVKNRNANWGFPKGHIELGETKYDAARREVLEETGIHVDIHYGFEGVSQYKMRDSIDKLVSIFVGSTEDTQTIIQKEEIARYEWLPFHTAIQRLKFDNDVKILIDAQRFLIDNGYIENEYPRPPKNPEIFYRGHQQEGLKIHTMTDAEEYECDLEDTEN